MIKNLNIQNYKSIKGLSLDCKKINLFIGKPNVGKSNILEAISLFQDGIGENIRKEDFRNLFFDQDIHDPIFIDSNINTVQVEYHSDLNQFVYLKSPSIFYFFKKEIFQPKPFYDDYLMKSSKHPTLYRSFIKKAPSFTYNFYQLNGSKTAGFSISERKKLQIKPYLFKKGSFNSPPTENTNLKTLAHPYGENLFTILKNNRPLLREVSELFKEYGYNLVIDFVTDQAEIQKNVDGVVYKIPFVLIADTLQRMIFHTCAIRSNKDNILLFEEPENHSFPPYIKRLAHEIIEDESNQFFIATHSPYLFDTIVSDAPREDVAVHIVTFENFQTKTRLLTEDEMATITNHGIDVFFNLNLFSNES